MITEKEVVVTWNANNKKHYVSKGYLFTKMFDEIKVKVSDLPKGTTTLVGYLCDYCNGKNQNNEKSKKKPYNRLLEGRKKTAKDCCSKCKSKKFMENQAYSEIPKEKTIYVKCPDLSKEWNYKRNTGTPKDYTYGSGKVFWWKCKKGHEWKSTVSNRRRGNNCPYCSNKKVCPDNCLAVTNKEVSKEWNYVKNKELTPHNVVSGSKRKVWWICAKGHEWQVSIAARTRGETGCPTCFESKGEKAIRGFLEREKINFIPQYKFSGLRGVNGGLLKFDFAILINNSVRLLIEFDGLFHFKEVYKGDGHDEVVKHDKLKDEYCYDNKIELLRIPYWEFDNLETILKKELSQLIPNFFIKN
jgi:Probable Zinc-ribbon domain